MASWGNSGLGEWGKMIAWWNTTSEWTPVARLAKNCLLWHYICFLCLFFFKGKEKLKSPLRLGSWMYLACKRRQEHLRLSEVSWEREQWLLSDCKHGLLYFLCFLRRHAKPVLTTPPPPPASIQTRPAFLASHRAVGCPGGSYFQWGIFWLFYLCTPLNAVLIGEGWDLRLPVTDTTKSHSLRNDFFFSHRPSH